MFIIIGKQSMFWAKLEIVLLFISIKCVILHVQLSKNKNNSQQIANQDQILIQIER